jgi:hypothetical protein
VDSTLDARHRPAAPWPPSRDSGCTPPSEAAPGPVSCGAVSCGAATPVRPTPTIADPAPDSSLTSADRAQACAETLRGLLGHVDGQWWRESDDTLLELLRTVDLVGRLATAALLEATAEIDRRGLAATHGCSGTAALLRHMLHLAPGEAVERARLANALSSEVGSSSGGQPPALPATAAAVRAGEVHLGQVRVIARSLADLPLAVEDDVRAEAEKFLADQARTLDPSRLGVVATHLRAYLDPDGMLAAERNAVRDRELSFTEDRRGRVILKGQLDPEGAAVLRTALDPLAAPRPATADGPDPRSPARRMADALVDLAHRALDAGQLPSSGGQRPHLTVTIDFDRLRDQLGAGELDRGGPLTVDAIRRLACDAKIIPVVLGSRGEPLDVGRAAYTVPAPMRRALVARDGGCAFPGCDRPPGWCEAHHVHHWANGGITKITNLVLLCGAHHQVVHHDQWRVRVAAGRPEFIPPPWIDPTGSPRRNITPRDLQRLATPA